MRHDVYCEVDLRSDIIGKIAESLPKTLKDKSMIEWLESKDCEKMVDDIIELLDKHLDHAIDNFKADFFEDN